VRTYIMGILNVTSDSFSDGGDFNSVAAAVAHAKYLIDKGADIIDIGGQSTRPGATLISVEEELSRIIPVIKSLRSSGVEIPISVDTFYSKVAREAIAVGADVINDISAGVIDTDMLKTCKELQVPIILNHTRGTPQTMKELAIYKNVVEEVSNELKVRINASIGEGIYRWNIWIDPGFGFAKQAEHSLELLKNLGKLNFGYPILVGVSRKGFIGTITKKDNPKDRVFGTAGAVVSCIPHADVVRIHDIDIKDSVAVADAIHRRK